MSNCKQRNLFKQHIKKKIIDKETLSFNLKKLHNVFKEE